MLDALPPCASRPAHALLLACAALTVIAGTTLAPALPVMQTALGPTFPIRLVVTVPALALALSAPLAGRLAGRVGPRRVLVVGLLLYAVAGASGLVSNGGASILVGRGLLGVAAAAVMTASTTIASGIFLGEARPRFFARQASVMSIAGVVSVALGGALATWHWRCPFAVYLVALPMSVLALRVEEPPASHDGRGEEPASGTRRAPVYLLTLAGMAFVFMVPIEVPFLLRDAGPSVAGLAVATTSLSASLSALLAARHAGSSSLTWLSRSFVLMAVGYALVGVCVAGAGAGTVTTFFGLTVAGVGSGWIMPHMSRWLVTSTPERSRSAALGALTSSVYAGQFLAPGVSALLGAGGRSFLGAACVLAVLGAALALVARSRRA